MFQELPVAAQNRVLKPLVRDAGKKIAAAEKSESPKFSGLMQKAIGESSLKNYSGGRLFITAGVRRGFKRAIGRTKRGSLRVFSKKATAANAELPVQDPTKYLHLVTKGRKAIQAKNRKVLHDARTGHFFGKSVAAAQPNPFVSRAFDAVKDAVVSEISAKAEDLILAEASSLMQK